MLLILLSAAVIAGQASTPENKEFTITARQYEFDPNVIRVGVGDNVTLKFFSEDVTHGAFIEGYEKNTVFKPGPPAEVNFIADKSGTFRIRCSYICGPTHPFMIGILVVEPNYTFYGSVISAIAVSIFSTLYFWSRRRVS